MENINTEKILENVPAINVKEENGQQLVSARELYKGLELKKRFSAWVEQNFKEFEENEDFTSVLLGTEVRNNGGFQHMELQDYEITIDMAKELCMMSHSKYGKVYRKYFIEVERRWNDPQEVIKRGYAYLQNENLQLKIENKSLHNENKLLTADNEEMKPKAIFADAVSASDTPVLVGELAKILKQNGISTLVIGTSAKLEKVSLKDSHEKTAFQFTRSTATETKSVTNQTAFYRRINHEQKDY